MLDPGSLHACENSCSSQTGYNLVVCSFALGDREGMKRAFTRMLEVPPYEEEDNEDAEMIGLLGREEDDMQNVSPSVVAPPCTTPLHNSKHHRRALVEGRWPMFVPGTQELYQACMCVRVVTQPAPVPVRALPACTLWVDTRLMGGRRETC